MQLRLALLVVILSVCFSSTALAGTPRLTFPLLVDDEDPATFSALSYVSGTAKLTLTSPLLCANMGTPVATAVQFKPYFGSFVFGPYVAGDVTDQGQAVVGVAAMNYGANGRQTISLLGDSSLVCYSLNASGVRKVSRDLFVGDFDTIDYDSRISVVVYDLPSFSNNYTYSYYVYVDIPTVNGPLRFVVRDGFDSSVFSRSVGQSWCLTQSASPSTCSGTTGDFGSGNINYTINLSTGQSFSRRFIVHRSIVGSTLPTSANPLVIAALFSPPELQENKLDNNLAVGINTFGNLPPSFSAVPDLAGLTEGHSLTTRSFVMQDDTAEGAGQLTATVRINYNGSNVDVTPSCVNSGGYTGTGTPVIKTCSFDVSPPTNFATSSTVSASVTITAVDPLGISTTNVQPLTVTSGDNDPPLATLSSVAAPDASNGDMPTLDCSVDDFGNGAAGASCTGSLPGFITGVAPGPADAADELATQTAAFVSDTSTGRSGNIACPLDTGTSASVFTLSGAPRLSSSSTAGSYDLVYTLNTVATGSVTCTINIRDAQSGGFPTGQSAQTITRQFRIVVSP